MMVYYVVSKYSSDKGLFHDEVWFYIHLQTVT